MNNKAFTLIELLAVIVILAVIALITVPAVMSVVSDAKQSAFKDSAYGLIKTADSEYVQDTFEDNITDKFFLFTNGVMTSYPSGSTLDYKGSTPLDGGLVLHSDGTVTMAIHDGTYCATKTRYVSEVTISVKTKTNCNSEILYSQATAPYSNLVTNGDFSNGKTSWNETYATVSVLNNTYKLTGNGTGASPYTMQSINTMGVPGIGKKFYAKAESMVIDASPDQIIFYVTGGAEDRFATINTPIVNQWYEFSGVITRSVGATGGIFLFTQRYASAAIANGKSMAIKNVIAVDLTTTYGVGSEPTVAQMDHNLNKVWIDTANSNTPKRFTAGGWISF